MKGLAWEGNIVTGEKQENGVLFGDDVAAFPTKGLFCKCGEVFNRKSIGSVDSFAALNN
jgi:hypothetical protein